MSRVRDWSATLITTSGRQNSTTYSTRDKAAGLIASSLLGCASRSLGLGQDDMSDAYASLALAVLDTTDDAYMLRTPVGARWILAEA